MENEMVFMESNMSGKSNYAMLMRLALAEALEDREARESSETTSEDAADVIVVCAGSVGSGLLNEGYVEITDLPVESERSRQAFKNIDGKKRRW